MNFSPSETLERGSVTRSSFARREEAQPSTDLSRFGRAAAHRAARLSLPRCGAGRSERGVALVITLILLSVITFMTVTFLVLSRSEHGSVATKTDQATAQYAAESALAQAEARVLSPILASQNEFNYGLMVSTNYMTMAGFQIGLSSFTNVSYTYPNGTPVVGNDLLQNLTNLFYDPRAPVFITNQLSGTYEFRYYYDLNQNGKFDPTGVFPLISSDPANPYYNTNGLPMPSIIPGKTISNSVVGDPQWIGILERPDLPHSSSNRFISRMAYLVVPSSSTLDINHMHNYVKALRPGTTANPGMTAGAGDGFLRDQGVGTWEQNLAAFLVDLNTNLWPTNSYIYNPNISANSPSAAFDDALSILRYRYLSHYYQAPAPTLTFPFPAVSNLLSVDQMFGQSGDTAFSSDGIDDYSGGLPVQLMWGVTNPPDLDSKRVKTPWAGADNPTHFFNLAQELFDTNKISIGSTTTTIGFVSRLSSCGTSNDTYNSTTLFRLLSQLGTDSAPEPLTPAGQPRMNLNYDNIDPTFNPQTGTTTVSATNFSSWTANNFFFNAAIRLLLDAGYTVGGGPSNILFVNTVGGTSVTNIQIQIYPTNYYTPGLHHLLQLAANIYDASTNRSSPPFPATYPFVPTVFRPVFSQRLPQSPVFITGYQEVTNLTILQPTTTWDDLSDLTRSVGPNDMVYGIPLIVGAKKGWPNFHHFALSTEIDITRKLQFVKPDNQQSSYVQATNQMYTLTNTVQYTVQLWNSYSNAFPRGLTLQAYVDTRMRLTNELKSDLIGVTGRGLNVSNYLSIPANILPLTWGGLTNNNFSSATLSITNILATNFFVISNGWYSPSLAVFRPIGAPFDPETKITIPQLWFRQNSRIRLYLVDQTTQRIVDYVNLDSTPYDAFTNLIYETTLDTANSITPTYPAGVGYTQPVIKNSFGYVGRPGGYLWATNRSVNGTPNIVGYQPYGLMNDIYMHAGWSGADYSGNAFSSGYPTNFLGFRAYLHLGPASTVSYAPITNKLEMYTPPTRIIHYYTDWQANDPLVHYTIGDLGSGYPYRGGIPAASRYELDSTNYNPFQNLNPFSDRGRYEPWAVNKQGGSPKTLPTLTDMTVKDPGITRSDDWLFPTNKYANAAWLGRVHRGTPWQTVYFKSPLPDPATWQRWSGDAMQVTNSGQISTTIIPARLTNGFPVSPLAIGSDAFFSRPTNDFRLLDLFTAAIDDNATRGQLSINQTNLAAWSAVLGGVIVLPDLTNLPVVIQPVGAYNALAAVSNQPPLFRLLNAINAARTSIIIYTNPSTGVTITNYPPANGNFSHLGDILYVPQLTVTSPFLNGNADVNDAVYERLPQQIMGLLKCDHTPRFVIYAYGQTLKPANHSIVTGGAYAGLCTNYQVTAEMATRAVVRIDGAPANPHVVLENFNVLPPN